MIKLSLQNVHSSLCYDVTLSIEYLKIDLLCDFSSEIDYNSMKYVFRNAIYLIINQCEPRRAMCASSRYNMSSSPAAHASEARLYIYHPDESISTLDFSHTNNTKLDFS